MPGYKKTFISVASFFFVFMLFIGYYAVAAEAGGRDNPLVTAGYLESLDLDKMIKDAFDSYMAEASGDIDRKIADAYAAINQMGSSGGSGPDLSQDEAFISAVAAAVAANYGGSAAGTDSTGIFAKVTIPAGKTMYVNMGSALFLRVGSAVCVANGNPGLIDTNNGTEIANGTAIVKNHLYVSTVENSRGVKNSGTAEAIVFVLGKYTLE